MLVLVLHENLRQIDLFWTVNSVRYPVRFISEIRKSTTLAPAMDREWYNKAKSCFFFFF